MRVMEVPKVDMAFVDYLTTHALHVHVHGRHGMLFWGLQHVPAILSFVLLVFHTLLCSFTHKKPRLMIACASSVPATLLSTWLRRRMCASARAFRPWLRLAPRRPRTRASGLADQRRLVQE